MEVFVYVALAITFAYLILQRWSRKGKTIPGPSGWPLVGYAPFIKKGQEHKTFFQLAEQYGELVKVKIFGETIIVLNSARMMRIAYTGEKYKTHTNDRPEIFIAKYVLFNSQGFGFMPKAYQSDHNELRKAFAKGFRVYGEGRHTFEKMVASELEQLVGRIEILNGKEFEMISALKRSFTNLMSILLAGRHLREGVDDLYIFWRFAETADFITSVDVNLMLSSFPSLRLIPGVYKTAFEKLILHRDKILRSYFHNMKATYKPEEVRGFVDFMIGEQHTSKYTGEDVLYTDEKIMAAILEIVFGGMITTVSALSSLFLCLLNFPKYQAKIQAELDRVVGRDRPPSLADRQACVFLEAVMLEIQRYATVVPLTPPHYCHEGIELEGYAIPPKSTIMANLWFILHDKELWGDPWTFRPERWLGDNGELLPNDHVYRQSWLAFGIGRRQCPGEGFARSRMFLYVATLLQRWTFEANSESSPSCDPRTGHYELNVTLRTKPYMCRAVPRK